MSQPTDLTTFAGDPHSAGADDLIDHLKAMSRMAAELGAVNAAAARCAANLLEELFLHELEMDPREVGVGGLLAER